MTHLRESQLCIQQLGLAVLRATPAGVTERFRKPTAHGLRHGTRGRVGGARGVVSPPCQLNLEK